MIGWIKGLFRRSRSIPLRVGDVAPDSLLNREPGTNIGAFVSIDPDTKIITAIFIP